MITAIVLDYLKFRGTYISTVTTMRTHVKSLIVLEAG